MSHENLERLAADAIQMLNQLREAAWLESGGLPKSVREARNIPLEITAGITPEQLAAQALESASAGLSCHESIRSGHAYCYSCRSAACEHSSPPSPGSVFVGYESTGKPSWQEFFNALLALGDARTERLFSDRPEVLSHVVERGLLIADQLVSFGKNSLTYRVWGEVIAGYVDADGTRAALTIQLVENTQRELTIHPLAHPILIEALANAPDNCRDALHRIYDALNEGRRQAKALTHLWKATSDQKGRRDVREKAAKLLRHLANSIERKGRQKQRRTAHAEIRASQQRPVHKAYEDLRNATQTDFFEDRYKNSVIVLGKSGRVHAFSEDGRHITSLVLKGDELQNRQTRKRYVPLTVDRAESVRNAALPELRPNSGESTETKEFG